MMFEACASLFSVDCASASECRICLREYSAKHQTQQHSEIAANSMLAGSLLSASQICLEEINTFRTILLFSLEFSDLETSTMLQPISHKLARKEILEEDWSKLTWSKDPCFRGHNISGEYSEATGDNPR